MSEITVKGSCLCGPVQYEVSDEIKRCRKATGTGHASNLLIEPQTSITWRHGESLLQRYKVSEAERFYNCFCQKCGAPMPRVVSELDTVLIPAGSLDTPPPVSPRGRIFWDSRAEWSCSDELPVFSEYPPQGITEN